MNNNNHSDAVDSCDAADASNTKREVTFFDQPRNVALILKTFYALCIILVLLDFFVHRHIYVYFETIPAFYAIYGFVACVVLVVLAKIMRKGLMRDEHYYDARIDEQDTPTLNDSSQATVTKEAQS
ncbi:hypothetical protein N8985_02820 [Glaciecola sp.]|mgnify:FL=1|jgi:hypothetical protein|nr:hypothetical protein [Glaciecola sp.]